MACVTIEADKVAGVLERATTALSPKPDLIRGAWERERAMLDDVREAARLVSANGLLGQWVVLNLQEARLLEPFLDPATRR